MMMAAEHRRPLLAFVVVCLVCAFTIGRGLRTEAIQQLIEHGVPAGVLAPLAPDVIETAEQGARRDLLAANGVSAQDELARSLDQLVGRAPDPASAEPPIPSVTVPLTTGTPAAPVPKSPGRATPHKPSHGHGHAGAVKPTKGLNVAHLGTQLRVLRHVLLTQADTLTAQSADLLDQAAGKLAAQAQDLAVQADVLVTQADDLVDLAQTADAAVVQEQVAVLTEQVSDLSDQADVLTDDVAALNDLVDDLPPADPTTPDPTTPDPTASADPTPSVHPITAADSAGSADEQQQAAWRASAMAWVEPQAAVDPPKPTSSAEHSRAAKHPGPEVRHVARMADTPRTEPATRAAPVAHKVTSHDSPDAHTPPGKPTKHEGKVSRTPRDNAVKHGRAHGYARHHGAAEHRKHDKADGSGTHHTQRGRHHHHGHR